MLFHDCIKSVLRQIRYVDCEIYIFIRWKIHPQLLAVRRDWTAKLKTRAKASSNKQLRRFISLSTLLYHMAQAYHTLKRNFENIDMFQGRGSLRYNLRWILLVLNFSSFLEKILFHKVKKIAYILPPKSSALKKLTRSRSYLSAFRSSSYAK